MEGVSYFDHTGDIGFEVRADSLEDLFRRAAGGLYEIMIERVPASGVRPEKFEIAGPEPDLMLRAFLSELLFRFLAHRAILPDLTGLRFEAGTLFVDAKSAAFDQERDGLKTELKAVTYHQLAVRKEQSGWSARVIFDV